MSVASLDIQQVLNAVSRWKTQSCYTQQALFDQLCLSRIRDVFRIGSWRALVQSKVLPSSVVSILSLLFLGIACYCCVPLSVDEEVHSLEFESIDDDIQRVRCLETSLRPSAKTSLQLAAEYMSLGKLGRYSSHSTLYI